MSVARAAPRLLHYLLASRSISPTPDCNSPPHKIHNQCLNTPTNFLSTTPTLATTTARTLGKPTNPPTTPSTHDRRCLSVSTVFRKRGMRYLRAPPSSSPAGALTTFQEAVAQRSPFRFLCQAAEDPGWRPGPEGLGMWYPRQRKNNLGRWPI